jgi:hypothetical protein
MRIYNNIFYIDNNNMNIGAYFQCYKEPLATFHALNNFRKAYPNSSIVLLSDNGYNYSAMAKMFNAQYIHSSDSMPPSTKNIINYKKYKKRFLEALELIQEDNFMILEDDVYVKSPYTEEFKGTINGNIINKIENCINIDFFYNLYGIDLRNKYYTGHGGSVYNKKNIISILLNSNNYFDDLIDNWTSIFIGGPWLCHDIFFSLLVVLNNFTISELNEHKDGTNYIHDNRAKTVHQYKNLYGVSPESISHLFSYN